MSEPTRSKKKELDKAAAIYFRDEFRQAREAALKDAEAFEQIVFVLEGLGSYCHGPANGLGYYRTVIRRQANSSPLAEELPTTYPHLHTSFDRLFEIVRMGRNDAMHEGVFARNLTGHAIEMSIVLEHSLMSGADRVRDYMVRGPECAEMWQPLSFIRQTMLKSSFSYLPVDTKEDGKPTWKLISDYALAQYLCTTECKEKQRDCLAKKLSEVVESGKLRLDSPHTCSPDTLVQNALTNCNKLPILVILPDTQYLAGILTPFDLL